MEGIVVVVIVVVVIIVVVVVVVVVIIIVIGVENDAFCTLDNTTTASAQGERFPERNIESIGIDY